MTVSDTMHAKLTAGLSPVSVEIEDESHKHAGHAGWQPGGETHVRVRIGSQAFEALSRIERHRMVHELLRDELSGGVHALVLNLKTPEEAGR